MGQADFTKHKRGCCCREQQCRGEASSALGLHHTIILLDLKHFYDSICLDLLVRRELDLECPCLLLQTTITIHEAARWILADTSSLVPDPALPKQGILAGCPQAVSLARVFLRPVMEFLSRLEPCAFLSTWIEDVGADLEDACVE